MQPARDHKVQHDPKIAFDADCDLLAHPSNFHNLSSRRCSYGRSGGTQQKRRFDYRPDELVAGDARSDSFHVYADVRQFWHE